MTLLELSPRISVAPATGSPYPAETPTIDAARSIRLLNQAVTFAGPGHRSPTYTVPGVPGSFVYWVVQGTVMDIVGMALAYTGVPVERLALCEGLTIVEALAIRRSPLAGYVIVTPAGQEVLLAAQKAQDDGKTWGEAHRQAKTRLLWARARSMS